MNAEQAVALELMQALLRARLAETRVVELEKQIAANKPDKPEPLKAVPPMEQT